MFQGNVDLIERACKELRKLRAYTLEILEVVKDETNRRVRVKTANLKRLDVYLADRPINSLDIKEDGTLTVAIPNEPSEATLDLKGFDEGRLAATRRAFL